VAEARRLFAKGERPSIDSIAAAAGVSRATFYRTFPSRAGLLDELDLEPEPDTRRRVLDAALELLQTQSLAALSMDELAAHAGVSRATLYRLYPGKAALFRAIILAYSPFEPVMAILAGSADRPPEELIPELALTAYRTVARRSGVVRALVFEITSMTPDTRQAFRETGMQAFGLLATYLAGQMAAGRLRPMNPLLALQGLVGAVMFHALAGPPMRELMGVETEGEQAVAALADNWLRGLQSRA